MKCKLTGLEGKAVDAHIIPRSFFAIDPKDKVPLKIVTNVSDEYTRRSFKGIYDRTIVTEEGEKLFSPWDDYGCEILLKRVDELELIHDERRVVAYQHQEYDYAKLKLFFLAVLWRAAVSSHPFFAKVKLGAHEDRIRKALLSSDPGDSDFYPVCLAIFHDRREGPGMMDPFPERYDGIRYYRFYLSSYIVYFKVDKKLAKEPFRSVQLAPQRPLIIIARELSRSKELPIMKWLAKEARDKGASP